MGELTQPAAGTRPPRNRRGRDRGRSRRPAGHEEVACVGRVCTVALALATLAGCGGHTSPRVTKVSATAQRAGAVHAPAPSSSTTARRHGGSGIPTSTSTSTSAPPTTVPASVSPPPPASVRATPPPTIPPLVAGSVAQLTFVNGGRTLPTALYVPAGVRPWPTVVFAAGYDIEPGAYDQLLRGWANAGFLVAAQASPGMAPSQGPVAEGPLPDVPGDLSTVASGLVSLGLADPSRLAAAGHSDGASAVAALALTADHADGRFRSFLVLAGDVKAFPDSYQANNRAPLFAATGDQDEYDNVHLTPQVYAAAAPPKVLVVAHGGNHLGSFLGDTPTAATMRAATRAFLRATVLGGPWSALTTLNGHAGLSFTTAGL